MFQRVSPMKSWLTVIVAAWPVAASAQADDVQSLLNRYSCYICHADDKAGAGPAFADVARKYRGDPDAARKLRAVVRNGRHGGGPWHMPPTPDVPDADARKMVTYILASRPSASTPP